MSQRSQRSQHPLRGEPTIYCHCSCSGAVKIQVGSSRSVLASPIVGELILFPTTLFYCYGPRCELSFSWGNWRVRWSQFVLLSMLLIMKITPGLTILDRLPKHVPHGPKKKLYLGAEFRRNGTSKSWCIGKRTPLKVKHVVTVVNRIMTLVVHEFHFCFKFFQMVLRFLQFSLYVSMLFPRVLPVFA